MFARDGSAPAIRCGHRVQRIIPRIASPVGVPAHFHIHESVKDPVMSIATNESSPDTLTQAELSGASTLRDAIEHLEMALPADSMDQDEEWVVVMHEGRWKKIRLHDYNDVFAVPGLYEKWVYEVLQCKSPQKVRDLLARAFVRERVAPESVVTLDLGAGNGFVAEELHKMGISEFVGIDLVPNAAVAAERDRPGLYTDFIVGDLLNLEDAARQRLDARRYTLMTCVAALGFGDIPTAVFAAAYNRVIDNGWVAFNIKTDFLEAKEPSGFSRLIRRMLSEGRLELAERESYVHRLGPDGGEIIYDAFVGRKHQPIPAEWCEED